MINELLSDLKKAKAKIQKNRLLAWSSNEGESSVGKITLLPLTAKAWVDLNVIDNIYLWRQSNRQ